MAINIDVRDSVATVTLSWPERRNAIGPTEARQIADALTDMGNREDVAVVVLTGNGAFSAGGDLPAILEMVNQGRETVAAALYNDFHALIRALVWLPKPTIAAVDGPAVGLGMDLALACDSRFIGSAGWLQQGWSRIGLIPGTGGELILRRLNPSLLWSLLSEQDQLSGEAAAAAGLAQSVDVALPRAIEQAQRLVRMPRATLEAYVELHREELRLRLDEHLKTCLRLQVALLCSADFATRASRLMERVKTGT